MYPIAVKASAIAYATIGRTITDLTVGTPPGHDGWLTWTGDVGAPTLAASLTPPGDSEDYRNPDNPSDRVLSVGDWVRAKPGTTSSSGVRRALDQLEHDDIVVPVWDVYRGTGSNVAYHVTSFIRVEITSYRLHPDNQISAKYLGPSTCAAPDNGPEATPTSASTAEDQPVTFELAGANDASSANLVFTPSSPANGTVALVGAPSCARDDDSRQPFAGSSHPWGWGWGPWGWGWGHGHGHGHGHDHGSPDGGEVGCTIAVTYTPAPDFFGSDEFTFTVSDGRTDSAPATVTLTVSEVNDPPVAGDDSFAADGPTVTIAAAELLANDTAGPANEHDQTLKVTAVTSGPDTHGTVKLRYGTVTYTPDAGFTGTATFSYTVCDDGTTAGQPDPLCSEGTVSVTVAAPPNQPPAADPATAQAVEDTQSAITLTGSDPDGDPLTFVVVVDPAHGAITGDSSELTYTPDPDYFGTDELQFTVSDGIATSPPATVSIVVAEVNDPPIPGDDTVNGSAGQNVVIDTVTLLANDAAGPPNESGQALTIGEVTAGPDTHGTVSLVAGVITYVPDVGFTGAGAFTYSVCDDGTTLGVADPLCTSTGTVTVHLDGANQPPVAEPGTLLTVEDTAAPITLVGSDPDGDPLTFVVVSPGNGTLTGAAPDLTYTPRADFFGTDTFTFAVSDGEALSAPATVSIDVSAVNDAPLPGADSTSAPGHIPTSISSASLLTNDLPRPSNESDQTLTVTAVAATVDTHGTVQIANGTITFIPDPAFAGAASFTYSVCDNGTTAGVPDPLCADGTVTIEVSPGPNTPPTGEPATLTATEDTTSPITLVGDDADGDSLAFAIAASPAHGTLTGDAPDLTYVPAPDYFGPDPFSFTVSDGQASSAPVDVVIDVTEVNDPPLPGADSVVAAADQQVSVDAATLLANDAAGPPNESGQTLAVTEVVAGPDTHGTVALVDGTITYTPDPGFTGPATFTYTVCDNGTTNSAPDPLCDTGGSVTVAGRRRRPPPIADPQQRHRRRGSHHRRHAHRFRSGRRPDHLRRRHGPGPRLAQRHGAEPDLHAGRRLLRGRQLHLHRRRRRHRPRRRRPWRSTSPRSTTHRCSAPTLYALGGAGTLPPPPPAPACGTPCGVIFGDPHLLYLRRGRLRRAGRR